MFNEVEEGNGNTNTTFNIYKYICIYIEIVGSIISHNYYLNRKLKVNIPFIRVLFNVIEQ